MIRPFQKQFNSLNSLPSFNDPHKDNINLEFYDYYDNEENNTEEDVVYSLYGRLNSIWYFLTLQNKIRKVSKWRLSSIISLLDEYDFNDQIEKDIKKTEADEIDAKKEYVREKRFYPVPVNVGCIKGAQCCYDPHCRNFCSLCYGKNLFDVQKPIPTSR